MSCEASGPEKLGDEGLENTKETEERKERGDENEGWEGFWWGALSGFGLGLLVISAIFLWLLFKVGELYLVIVHMAKTVFSTILTFGLLCFIIGVVARLRGLKKRSRQGLGNATP
jgi:hypothetical protein